MGAVFKREIKAYMNNVYGYLFMAILLMFCGAVIFVKNLLEGSPNIEYALFYGKYVLILLIPVLCMRSMSEDKRNKTDLFYLTLPMPTASVVLGKYFALLTVYAIPCGILSLYPLVFGLFGTVNFLSAYMAVLHFFLLGAALIAICLFLSSLTENLVISAVLGILVLVVLFFLPTVASVYPTTALASFIGLAVFAILMALAAFALTKNLTVTSVVGALLIVPLSVIYIAIGRHFAGLVPAILAFLSPFDHFERVATYALFSVPSLVLLLSYPAFFVFLTVRVADKRRWA